MKSKKLLKLMDGTDRVTLWTNDDEENPAFEGFVMDVPWYLTEYKIGREDDEEEPIFMTICNHPKNKDIKVATMIINLIAE